MRTRNSVILISAVCMISLFLVSLYIPAYMQCSDGLQWNLSCSFPERTASFEEFVEQKATNAFEIKLQKYDIDSVQLTVQDGFRWNDEFFMAESIASDGNRYYLMAVFPHDLPVEKIDVQIFEIISNNCVTAHIQSKQGCAPEYIRDLKNTASISKVDDLLAENQIDYLPEILVVASGPSFSGDPGCGAVMDVDDFTHWFKIDSQSNPQIMTVLPENPNPCEVNTTSCFCNAQMELTALTLNELSYFSDDEEEEYATILIYYLKNNNVNVTPKFQIGKLNLNFTDMSAIGYCGELWGDNRNDFFSGAIVNGYVKDYGLDKKLPLLCAISDDAKWWERR